MCDRNAEPCKMRYLIQSYIRYSDVLSLGHQWEFNQIHEDQEGKINLKCKLIGFQV